ncbi:MAG: amidase family protein [Woeseiaceae bacterium]|nr:amidase family protein [Woeseiaceae bacterium]
MPVIARRLVIAAALLPIVSVADFDPYETTISEIHGAMAAGDVTARQLVEYYLARIEAYDKQGPAINSIITMNPNALQRADALDRAYRRGGLSGPLHGIPMIVKDNYDTADMPTSAGSLALKNSLPPDDAFQVKRIREAGAIIIAKSNLFEFAFSPYETVNSALPGHTRNPYALNRVPAGSSGGTGAAIAANFAVVGLGTDTGNSIRGPSSHNALVGIRSSMGLTSRDGIVPLFLDHDIGGPMARSVADAAVVLDVIAGHDPADPVTAEGAASIPASYADYLLQDGLQDARLGVVRQLSNRDGADPEVKAVFADALVALWSAGAELVDPVELPQLAYLAAGSEETAENMWCSRFRYDLDSYLESLGTEAPVKSLKEVIDSGLYHPNVLADLEYFQEIETPPEQNEECIAAFASRQRLRDTVTAAMREHDLDALVFPTWANPPRLIGDLNTPHGDNSQQLAPHTGFPAITVPMGFTHDGLPLGLQFFGELFDEATLIRLAYSFEQATRHRVAPPTTPPL